MPTVTRQDAVFILDLGADENRLNPDWLASLNAALDEVEAADGPKALVTTATGKFFSNGLDLAWLQEDLSRFIPFVTEVEAMLARVLALPVVTVAAIQGHAFAAGAMLATAHDLRVMRADRGFYCLPEVDIKIPFTPGMSALLQAKLAPQAAHRAMVTGQRFGGPDAVAAGIVDAAVAEDQVLPTAIELAQANAARHGKTVATIKSGMYAEALRLLRAPDGRSLG